MVHFCNPELLGSEKSFHRVYQSPILRGRNPIPAPYPCPCPYPCPYPFPCPYPYPYP